MTFWTDEESLAKLIADLKDYRSPSGFKVKITNYAHTVMGHRIEVKLARSQVKYLMKSVDIRERYER